MSHNIFENAPVSKKNAPVMLLWGNNRRAMVFLQGKASSSRGAAPLPDSPERASSAATKLFRKINLLRPRGPCRLPIHRFVHHLAHLLKPPICPAHAPLSASDRIAGFSFSENQFHLFVGCHNILSLLCANPDRGGWTRAVQGKNI